MAKAFASLSVDAREQNHESLRKCERGRRSTRIIKGLLKMAGTVSKSRIAVPGEATSLPHDENPRDVLLLFVLSHELKGQELKVTDSLVALSSLLGTERSSVVVDSTALKDLRAGALERVAEMLAKFPDSVRVVAFRCKVLNFACRVERGSLLNMGAVEAIIRTTRTHRDNAIVDKDAAGALRTWAETRARAATPSATWAPPTSSSSRSCARTATS